MALWFILQGEHFPAERGRQELHPMNTLFVITLAPEARIMSMDGKELTDSSYIR
jgi:hypothetical protein